MEQTANTMPAAALGQYKGLAFILAQLPPPIIIFVGVKTPIGFFARLINVGLLKFRHAKKTASIAVLI